MKFFFAQVSNRGMLPEVFVSYQKVGGILQNLNFSTIPYIAQARNELVQKFLKSDADYLVMLDNDMPLPANFGTLLAIEGKAVAPLTWCRMDNLPWPSIFYWLDEEELKKPDGSLFKSIDIDYLAKMLKTSNVLTDVGVIASGCYKLRRDLVEDIIDEHGGCYYDDWYDEWGNLRYGEDVYFFNEMRKRKESFIVRLDVEVGHLHYYDLKYLGHARWPQLIEQEDRQ